MVLDSIVATSFAILLLFSLPSCLRLRATLFSAEGVGACASSLYSSDTSPDTDPRSGYCTPTRTFHSMRAPSFSSSSDVSFAFSAIALFFPPPWLQPRADQRSSTWVWGESVLLLAFLHVCHRGGYGGTCHALVILAMRSPGLRYCTTKAHSAAAVGIYYEVGGVVVSPRRVQG
jgi:hypothetical protein